MLINKSNSDIINYRPNLRMEHIPSLNPTYDDSPTKSDTVILPSDNRSGALLEFEEYAPHETLCMLDDTISVIQNAKKSAYSDMLGNKYAILYKNAQTVEECAQFAQENQESIFGTTYLESYLELDRAENEVLDLRKEYSLLTYGDDIGLETAAKIDTEFINRASSFESDNDESSINYTSLYFESMISNMIRQYSHSIIDEGLSYTMGIFEECKDMPFDDKYSKLLLNNFKKKQEILKNDISKDEKTSYNIRVALRNAFFALQEYEDSLEALDGSDIMVNDIELATELKRDSLTSLSNSLISLMHILRYSPIAKSDIGNILREKSNLRGYFVESL